MRISDWSSDVCSSDLEGVELLAPEALLEELQEPRALVVGDRGQRVAGLDLDVGPDRQRLRLRRHVADGLFQLVAGDHRLHVGHLLAVQRLRSEEHTSELQSLMRTSYAVFCLKKKTTTNALPS